VKMRDGTFFISDEYGPIIYHFSSKGELIEMFSPPAALIPRAGANFGSRKMTSALRRFPVGIRSQVAAIIGAWRVLP
jgi:hypothetical protein